MDPNAPAFPEINSYAQTGIVDGHEVPYTEILQSGGLTIRAELAKCIMASLYTQKGSTFEDSRGLAAIAVKAADALIAELNKK